MAPQIFFQPSYSKAVDIWCCAIIMYIMLKGKHPIYEEGMSNDEYKKELQQCKFPPLENSLANSFLSRICQNSYADRYSANEALRHPWITRNIEDEVPLSVNESIHSFNTAHSISESLKFVYYVGLVSETKWEIPRDYIEKVNMFTSNHEQYRSRSPSFKRISRKTKNAIIKIKEIYIEKDKKETFEPEYEEISSPLIKKHEKLFSRLFEKGRNVPKNKVIELQPIQIIETQNPKLKQQEAEDLRNSFNLMDCSIQESLSNFSQVNSPVKQTASYRHPIGKFESVVPAKLERSTELKTGVVKKMNSLRTDQKYQQKSNYFRNSLLKKSSFDLRDTYNKTTLKQMPRKHSIEKVIENGSLRKPQTSDSRRSSNAKKGKPMIFGMGGGGL